jgi:non-ribosomal peptide synthetase component E (peptide arylation enzyme)
MKSTMMSCPLLIRSMIERAGKLFPSVEIVSAEPAGPHRRSTMRDLDRRSRRLAAALQSAGVVPGDFVTVKELPYSATGKLLKTKLRQDFSNWGWDSALKPATISAN